MSKATEREFDHLEADKEIPGQRYCCLSFVSPNKVLKDKAVYLFSEFLKDYEIQYKIRATETFLMAEAAKVQEALSSAQDLLENLVMKGDDAKVVDISGVLATIRDTRATLTRDVAADLEAHVKKEMADYKESSIQEAYNTFLFTHKKRLEEAFFEKNDFNTTVQGLKIRGVYDTYGEAQIRAKLLQKTDPIHNVFIGQVGFWLPWDPEPHDVSEQEYAHDELNTLMKKYKENLSMRDELYAQEKLKRTGAVKVRDQTAPVAGAAATEGGAAAAEGGAGAGSGAGGAAGSGLFDSDDLALRRKLEAAKNTITYSA
jgi:hypothetical protein